MCFACVAFLSSVYVVCAFGAVGAGCHRSWGSFCGRGCGGTGDGVRCAAEVCAHRHAGQWAHTAEHATPAAPLHTRLCSISHNSRLPPWQLLLRALICDRCVPAAPSTLTCPWARRRPRGRPRSRLAPPRWRWWWQATSTPPPSPRRTRCARACARAGVQLLKRGVCGFMLFVCLRCVVVGSGALARCPGPCGERVACVPFPSRPPPCPAPAPRPLPPAARPPCRPPPASLSS